MVAKKPEIPIVKTFEIKVTSYGGYQAWYKCPHCKVRLHSDERELRRYDQCPECGQLFCVSWDAATEIDSLRRINQSKKDEFNRRLKTTGIPIALAIIFLGFAFALRPLVGYYTRWESFLLYLGAVFIFLVVVEIGNGGKTIGRLFKGFHLNMKKSNVILLIGGVLLLLCLLYPPWSYTYQSAGISQVMKSGGYGFLLSPPEPEKDFIDFGVVLDWSRLVLQVAVIGIATAGAWFFLGQAQKNVKQNTVERTETRQNPLALIGLLFDLELWIRIRDFMIISIGLLTIGWLFWPDSQTVKTADQINAEKNFEKEVYKMLNSKTMTWEEAHEAVGKLPDLEGNAEEKIFEKINRQLAQEKKKVSWEEFDKGLFAEIDRKLKQDQKNVLSHNSKIYYKVKQFVDDHPKIKDLKVLDFPNNYWDTITRPFRVNRLLSRQEHKELLYFLTFVALRDQYVRDPSLRQAIEELKQWDFTYTH